jgi:hypothetical protein
MRLIVFCLFLIVSPIAAFAACVPQEDLGLDAVAGIPHQEVVRHEQAGLGIQDRFFDDNGRRNLSYIRFDFGHERIDDAIEGDHFRGAMSDMDMAARMNGGDLGEAILLDPAMAGSVEFDNVMFASSYGRMVVLEFLGQGHDGSCIHKIRYSEVVPMDLAAVDEAHQPFLTILEELTPFIDGQ